MTHGHVSVLELLDWIAFPALRFPAAQSPLRRQLALRRSGGSAGAARAGLPGPGARGAEKENGAAITCVLLG